MGLFDEIKRTLQEALEEAQGGPAKPPPKVVKVRKAAAPPPAAVTAERASDKEQEEARRRAINAKRQAEQQRQLALRNSRQLAAETFRGLSGQNLGLFLSHPHSARQAIALAAIIGPPASRQRHR